MNRSMAAHPYEISTEWPIRMGLVLIVVGFCGFWLWAALAPLTSAAIANGIVVADSRNKSIEHLEGGIIREVLVQEGDRVEAGQVLVRLDSATVESNLARLNTARLGALALEARLKAERDGLEAISFPKELEAQQEEPKVAEAIRGQMSLFAARKEAQASERAILKQRIAQYDEEIKGLEAQVESEDQQLSLISDEIAGASELMRKGLERKSRVLQLQRAEADIKGQRGAHVAEIARVRQSIAEMQERLINLRAQRLDDAVSDLRDVQTKLADFEEQIFAASDASRRLELKAPVAGTIISVYHQTPGGVVKPGEKIMDLVPDHDQLVIEAQVRPQDIDTVVPNSPAHVKLTAFSSRWTPKLLGRVERISADRVVDQSGKKAYYLARVVVRAEALGADSKLKLYPGMPAQVFIETGRQTMLEYLLSPLLNATERAMREG